MLHTQALEVMPEGTRSMNRAATKYTPVPTGPWSRQKRASHRMCARKRANAATSRAYLGNKLSALHNHTCEPAIALRPPAAPATGTFNNHL